MTKIKLCGLSRTEDIETVNKLKPEYVGFVFAPESRRYVTPQTAAELKQLLSTEIQAVGVFVNESPKKITELLHSGIIGIIQLHGDEDEDYIRRLKQHTDKPIIKAFRVETENDIADAERCPADYILLDSGAGTGTVFDWKLLMNIRRPYFLAGGLSPDTVGKAVTTLHPFAVDVSSGIETGGTKDKEKMAAFVAAVRKEERL